jgi:hypothetical protein
MGQPVTAVMTVSTPRIVVEIVSIMVAQVATKRLLRQVGHLVELKDLKTHQFGRVVLEAVVALEVVAVLGAAIMAKLL